MPNVIEIFPVDDVYVQLKTERGIEEELREQYTFDAPNARFMPSFKAKYWDGKIRLFQIGSGRIYRGLAESIKEFAASKEYEVQNHCPVFSSPESTEVNSFLNNLKPTAADGTSITYHDFQRSGIEYCLQNPRTIIVSPTASGKSLMIYSIIRWLTIKQSKKILLLVPSTQLVEQMYSDFQDYSQDNKWDVEANCHRIYEGHDKNSTKPIFISTWQSIFRFEQMYFDQFGCVIVDEVHTAKADSIRGIMEKLTDCPHRFGFTGTLDETQCHILALTGLFGEPNKIVTTKELMDDKKIASLKIDCVLLKHPLEHCKPLGQATYSEEIDYLIQSYNRNQFLANLCKSLNGNTLILTTRIDKHLLPLAATIESSAPDKKVFTIHGDVETMDREDIRKEIELLENGIIVGSYACVQQGVNIKNIHNIIFATPSKSMIRVLQSIGRGLRTSDTKKSLRLFDVADDLRGKRKTYNTTLKHLMHRVQIYSNEKFTFKLINISLR